MASVHPLSYGSRTLLLRRRKRSTPINFFLRIKFLRSNWTLQRPIHVAPSQSQCPIRVLCKTLRCNLAFFKPRMGGPYFDLELLWDEHTYYEFGARNVEHTMATMVQEPYVNHIPTVSRDGRGGGGSP